MPPKLKLYQYLGQNFACRSKDDFRRRQGWPIGDSRLKMVILKPKKKS